jgi:hypothetical protein
MAAQQPAAPRPGAATSRAPHRFEPVGNCTFLLVALRRLTNFSDRSLQVMITCRTVDQVATHIVRAHQVGSQAIFGFPWGAAGHHNLVRRLEDKLAERKAPKIRNFAYDHISRVAYVDARPESEFHFQVQAGLRQYLENGVAQFLRDPDTEDETEEFRRLIRSLITGAKFEIKEEAEMRLPGAVSYNPHVHPYLMCEVS